MKITYIGHSGFVAELEHTILIFDYYKGRLPEFTGGKKIYVFASHAHRDHFQKRIFDWKEKWEDVTYILSDDIRAEKEGCRIVSIGPRQMVNVDDLTIRTFRSTDEGVAFLVEIEGNVIYHAGDLNWWHWEEEGPAYNEMMKRNYQHEIQKLKGEAIDVAFLPLDPRQGEQYYWGLDYYMKHTDTARAFPMHMWEDYKVYDRLMANEASEGYRDRVMHITEEGQTFELKG